MDRDTLPASDNLFRPKKIGLVVGLPFCGRNVVPDWALSFALVQYPANTNIEFHVTKGLEIAEARTKIVEDALAKDATYVWFVDDDTAMPSFAVRRLVKDLQEHPDAAIAAGIYCSKTDDPEPNVFRKDEPGAFWRWKVGEVFECDGIATGCMVVRTSVFHDLERPWFRTINAVPDGLVDGEIVLGARYTDDLYFCEKVRAAGWKILADGNVNCVHWDRNTQRAYYLPKDSYPLQGVETEEAGVAAI